MSLLQMYTVQYTHAVSSLSCSPTHVQYPLCCSVSFFHYSLLITSGPKAFLGVITIYNAVHNLAVFPV